MNGIDMKDVAIIATFIGTCAVLLYRVGAAEKALSDHEQRLRDLEKSE